jgi:hypothetical protein
MMHRAGQRDMEFCGLWLRVALHGVVKIGHFGIKIGGGSTPSPSYLSPSPRHPKPGMRLFRSIIMTFPSCVLSSIITV